MFDDLAQLRALAAHLERKVADAEVVGAWLASELVRVRAAIAAAERGESAGAPARRPPPRRAAPAPTPYVLERERLSGGARTPLAVHREGCRIGGAGVALTAADAAAALADGVPACEICDPDAELGAAG